MSCNQATVRHCIPEARVCLTRTCSKPVCSLLVRSCRRAVQCLTRMVDWHSGCNLCEEDLEPVQALNKLLTKIIRHGTNSRMGLKHHDSSNCAYVNFVHSRPNHLHLCPRAMAQGQQTCRARMLLSHCAPLAPDR